MIETRLQMSTVVLFFCLRLRTWLSIYKRLIALALAGGSGTELPASGRIAGGHSERLNSRLKTAEQVAARCKMFCMNQSAVVVKTHFTLNDVTVALQTTSPRFLLCWKTFVLASVGNKSVKHLLTGAWRKSNPVPTEIQPT